VPEHQRGSSPCFRGTLDGALRVPPTTRHSRIALMACSGLKGSTGAFHLLRLGHSSAALMAFSPQIAPLARFALWDGLKLRSLHNLNQLHVEDQVLASERVVGVDGDALVIKAHDGNGQHAAIGSAGLELGADGNVDA
jgi:hypothetical protein